MKYFLVALILTVGVCAGASAQARAHKIARPRVADRQMTAEPKTIIVPAPNFRWSGLSSWGAPSLMDDANLSNANGS